VANAHPAHTNAIHLGVQTKTIQLARRGPTRSI
jgi:hypothetical protein